MYKLIRLYNQNRRKFWRLIITVIIIVALSYYLINILSDNLNSQSQYINNSGVDTNTLESVSMPSQKSAITGQNITSSQREITIIDNFITYCNSGKIEEAYKLLSEDCKKIIYPNINDFKEKYYDKIFGTGKKTVEMENWIDNIYKVDFYEDFISSGSYTDSRKIQDYITIVTEDDGEYKLNINKYLWTENINRENSQNNISLKAIKKEVYMDYEIYTLEIKNNSNKEISLGDIQYMDASYLIDKNDLQYNASVTEITPTEMSCGEGETKNVSIKYLNRYSSTRDITAIVFPKIILNNYVYKMITNKDKYNNYTQIIINL